MILLTGRWRKQERLEHRSGSCSFISFFFSFFVIVFVREEEGVADAPSVEGRVAFIFRRRYISREDLTERASYFGLKVLFEF